MIDKSASEGNRTHVLTKIKGVIDFGSIVELLDHKDPILEMTDSPTFDFIPKMVRVSNILLLRMSLGCMHYP